LEQAGSEYGGYIEHQQIKKPFVNLRNKDGLFHGSPLTTMSPTCGLTIVEAT